MTENNIPNGWIETALGEIAQKMYSGGTPSTKHEEYYGGTIPWIRTQEVVFNFIKETDVKITELGLKNSSARYIPVETVIVAMYGNSAGRVALSKIKATTNQACCNIISNSTTSYPYFIFYNLLGRYKEIEGKANGAAQQNLSVGVLKDLNINLPPLQEQKAIANILTAFDNKIELLQDQNKTLETTAQTIFKEWFGKYKVGDELPDGWKVRKIGDLANHIKISIKPFNHPNEDYIHYSLPAYDKGLIPLMEKGTDIMSNKYLVKDYTFLVSKLNPFTPRIWTVFNAEANHICSTEFQVLQPKKDIYFSFLHCFLNSDYYTKEISKNIQGTSSSHQRVKPDDIFNLVLIIPNEQRIKDFEESFSTLILKKDKNHQQIQTLTKTRDTLLPKLMSGQLRVNLSACNAQADEFKENIV